MRLVAIAAMTFVLAACGSSSPVASTTPSPASSPSAACLPLNAGTPARATITDIRVGTHTGYDRVVVEFAGGMPTYRLAWQDPETFVGPASGIPVSVAGVTAIHLYIYGMDVPPTYQHGTNMSPNYAVLKQVVVMGVFEGQADIAIGLGRGACPTVTEMTGPNRLVIDFTN